MILRKALRIPILIWRRSPRLTILFAVIALILLLFPYKTTVVPEWRIRVIDETGNPFQGATVRQSWYHYSYDVGGIDDLTADEVGYVVFPARTFTAPLLYRVLRGGLAYLRSAHGRLGIRSSVWAYSTGVVSDFIDYTPGIPPTQEIVLRRQS
jgi:hypothetical protein